MLARKLYHILIICSLSFIDPPPMAFAQSPSPSPTPFVIQVPTQNKDFLDYALAVIQLAALLGLILYVYKTWQIASANKRSAELSQKSIELSLSSIELSKQALEEMKASRLQEIAPYVIVYIDMPYGNDWVMFLVVKNIGKTVAKDIKFKFEPALMTGFGDKIKEFDIYLLREGISSLAPMQEIRTPLDVHSNYLKDKLPTIYKVQVNYSGVLQPNEIVTEQVIDLSMFNDLTVLQKKGESNVIEALEEIARTNNQLQRYIGSIAETLNSGIWLKNPEFFASGLEIDSEHWKFFALAKLKEFSILWTYIYAGRFERRGQLFFKSLQSRLAIMGSQLLRLVSVSPDNVPTEVTNSLQEIAVKFGELSEARFNVSRASYEAFNVSGDEAVNLVDGLLRRLNALVKTEDEVTD